MLEKEFMKQQIMQNNSKTINRDMNSSSYNTQKNLNFFQNGILSEKMRPLSVKNNSKNITFNKGGKPKKKKTKNKIK